MTKVLKTIFDNKPLIIVFGAFGITILTFVANIYFSYNISLKLEQSVARVEKTMVAMLNLQKLTNDITVAEAGLRTYYINPNKKYLQNYRIAIRHIKENQDFLIRSESDGSINQEHVALFRTLMEERLNIFYETEAFLRSGIWRTNDLRAVHLFSIGGAKTADLKEVIEIIEQEEKNNKEVNSKYISRSIKLNKNINYVAIFVALVISIFATISITQDFYRQKLIEKFLTNLNDDKNKFFSILSHDLRTPLTGINASIYLLENHYHQLDDHEKIDLIHKLGESSKKYQKLLDDTLTWSRLQMNKMVFHPVKFNLHDEIQELIGVYGENCRDKHIEVFNEIPEETTIYADKNMLQTVVRNIFSNAIKFTNPGGKILFKVQQSSKYLSLSIADEGVGIPKELLEKLFHNNSITTLGTANEAGTGLGLNICREFLNKTGGRLHVKSQVGLGSTFTIDFPMLAETEKDPYKKYATA
jgi:signal transduction histidine kinase